MQPTRHSIRLPNTIAGEGTHELVFFDWGDPMADRTVVCVHGLTRNARDFDKLAEGLARRGRRVLTLDIAGRGESEWLANPVDYSYPSYLADCLRVLENFHLRQVDWIGTSMGGIIGMVLASSHPGRIRKLVLNDVGIHLRKEALQRIYAYVGSMPTRFATREEADAYLAKTFAPFAIHGTPFWPAFVEQSIMPHPEGGFRLTCDPAIVEPLRQDTKNFTDVEDVNLAAIWEEITIPTLILRGEHSDILDAETVSAMRATNPGVSSEVIAGVGHAPALMSDEQVALIANWLDSSGIKLPGI